MSKYGPEKAKLLFTDTDNLTYQIQTDDLYKDMEHDLDLYDTSNYHRGNPLYSVVNKKKIGKFKDETGGLPILEWVGLRAKMYSMVMGDGKEKKTGKGINKFILKKDVRHQVFKDCLFQLQEYQQSMMGFRSQQHQLYTIKQVKKSLSPFDDKRCIIEDGFTTGAHGHWRNGIARPSQTPTEADPSEEGLREFMTALSLSSPTGEPSTDLAESHADVEKPTTDLMNMPLPEPCYEPSTDLAESHADVQEPTTDLMDIPLPEPCHEPSTDLTETHADAEEPVTDLMDIPSPGPCHEPSTDLTESHADVEEPSTDLVSP